MNLVKGIHHVSMKCCSEEEYRKTVAFYRDILGLVVAPKDIVISSQPPYPARIAFCKGPLGEEIEFFCTK